MSNWHRFESDYMEADQSYLIHLSENASDHKYFVGVLTGRFKDIIYFRDVFDNEIALQAKDYLHSDGSIHIDFIPIKEINDLVYDKTPKSEVVFNGDMKEEALIGTINCVKREDETDTFICNIQTINNTKFTCAKYSSLADDVVGNFMTGDNVNVKIRKYKNELPMLISIEKNDEE